jgi:hypothetical protein
VLISAFVASRLGFYLAGLRYNNATLRVDSWQLLDTRQLRSHLIDSVWHLQSQPPLFNLFSGMMLKLPSGLADELLIVLWLGLGLTTVLCSYLLLVELRVPRWISVGLVIVFVVASPSYILWEDDFGYTYPTMTFMVVGFLLLIRYLRRSGPADGVGAFSCFGGIVLMNSHYQILWMMMGLALLLVFARARWRQVVVVALVPLLVVAFWYVRSYAMFGTATTSSWMGMNLAKGTLDKAPTSELKRLVANGTLGPIALIVPFSPPEAYIPKYGRLPKTGVPVLDESKKSNGITNYNNLIYIKVSAGYLRDDLSYISAEPGAYAKSVTVAAQLWITPPDQEFAGSHNWGPIRPYASVYDRAVDWQPHLDELGVVIALYGKHLISASWLSYSSLIAWILALVGLPIITLRRRRSDPAGAAFFAFLWITLAYGLVVTSLLELGENSRFSFELGPLPVIAATSVLLDIVRCARKTPGARTDELSEPSEVHVLTEEGSPMPTLTS